MPCGRAVEKAKCFEVCGMTMDCGHVCDEFCHKGKQHDEILCTKPCTRTCPEGHPCTKKCKEECGNCLVKILKMLPCGHEVIDPNFLNFENNIVLM